MKTIVSFIGLALALTLLQGPAFSHRPVQLQPDKTMYPLEDAALEYLEDPEKKLTIEDVASGDYKDRFVLNRQDVINLGYTTSAYWVRFTLENNGTEHYHLLLDVAYALLDYISLYRPGAGGGYTVTKYGQYVLFEKREVKNRNFVFKLHVPPGASKTYYLRVETEDSFTLPMTVYTQDGFRNKDHIDQIILGLLYGVLIIMLLYNLIIYFSARNLNYLYLVLFILSFLLYIASENGIAYEFIWPASPWWAKTAVPFAVSCVIITSSLFVQRFIRTRENVPGLDRAIVVFRFLGIAGIGISLFSRYYYSIMYVVIVIVFYAPVLMAAGCICIRKGSRTAVFFIAAWSFLLLGTIAYGLKAFGILPEMFITKYGVPLGASVQMVLLSLGLADIINTMKNELKALNTNLEFKVKERTIELEAALEELEATNDALLTTRDQLWGEMQLAKKIQTVLVPDKPVMEDYDIAAIMSPAAQIGGDYYDVINVEGRDWIVIGDVSGHGVPAGLIMMMVQTSIQVVLRNNPDIRPSGLLSAINYAITDNVHRLNEDKYMTITVLACHNDGEFNFSGLHQDILICRAESGSIDVVETDGAWIGIMDDIDGYLVDRALRLEVGDIMLLYTDGITEAWKRGSIKDVRDPETEMYGQERLLNTFQNISSKEVDDIKAAILSSLNDYDMDDDVTFVVIKRNR